MTYPGALVLIVAGIMLAAVAGVIVPGTAFALVIVAIGIVTIVAGIDEVNKR